MNIVSIQTFLLSLGRKAHYFVILNFSCNFFIQITDIYIYYTHLYAFLLKPCGLEIEYMCMYLYIYYVYINIYFVFMHIFIVQHIDLVFRSMR